MSAARRRAGPWWGCSAGLSVPGTSPRCPSTALSSSLSDAARCRHERALRPPSSSFQEKLERRGCFDMVAAPADTRGVARTLYPSRAMVLHRCSSCARPSCHMLRPPSHPRRRYTCLQHASPQADCCLLSGALVLAWQESSQNDHRLTCGPARTPIRDVKCVAAHYA